MEEAMYRFFVTPEQTKGEYITITGSDVNHIKNVLRMKCGTKITISDGQDKEYYCIIDLIEDDRVLAKIEDIEGTSAELSTKITLFQGLPKSDKLELIIQKAVELGVYEIVPVKTKRSVVKLDVKKQAKKTERWNNIALSAAKQAKRSVIPVVREIMTFDEAIAYGKNLSMNIIPYEDAQGIVHSKEVIDGVFGKESLGIFIGPEGGFEEKEVGKAMAVGIEPITLGHRILRTETAGITTLSIIMFSLETKEQDEI